MTDGATAGLRRTLRDSQDPRVARTRRAILDAVHRLAGEGDVSATDVIREAGVSRASFYSHFDSLSGLATAALADAFVDIRERYDADTASETPAEALRRSQVRLVRHFAEYRRFYRSVFALPLTHDAHLANVRAMAESMEPELVALPGRPAGVDPAMAARYISSAAFGLLHAWVCGEVDASEAVLVEHLLDLLPRWFPAGPIEPPDPLRSTEELTQEEGMR